jgi:hypothetical protein
MGDNHVLSPPAGERQREGDPDSRNGAIQNQTLTLSLSLIVGRGDALSASDR